MIPILKSSLAFLSQRQMLFRSLSFFFLFHVFHRRSLSVLRGAVRHWASSPHAADSRVLDAVWEHLGMRLGLGRGHGVRQTMSEHLLLSEG